MEQQIEKRRAPRTNILCRVKISHHSFGEKIVNTRDISDEGLFILIDPTVLPSIGTVIKGKVLGLKEESKELDMRIVRCEDRGAGFQFVA